MAEETAVRAGDAGVRENTSIDAIDEMKPRKLSARKRLDSLSSFRMNLGAVRFSSSTSHRGGGKARVVQATVRGKAGNEEIVAVKKLNFPEGMEIHKFSNEFVHEVEILAGLSHQHVVCLIGFVEELEQGEAWIILPWYPNGNVREFLATGEWEIPERISLIKDTFEGLGYLHTRNPPICHGDLKSLNILVSSSYRAVITDFGSARVLHDSTDRMVSEDCGPATRANSTGESVKIQVGARGNQLTLTGPAWSLRWAAPEVLYGATQNLPSDIWSAGWVCWEIMTGKVPFPELSSASAITLTVIGGSVPSTRENAQLSQITSLCSLMSDCWELDPKDRPSIFQCQSVVVWMPSTPPSDVKAPSLELLLQMGQLHFSHNRHETAASHFRQALAIARSAGETPATAFALGWLGRTYYSQTKYSEAEESFAHSKEICILFGDDAGQASTLQGLGNLYYSQSKYSEAEESYLQAQQIFHRIGDDRGRANTLRGLGDLYYSQGNDLEAEKSYIQAQDIYTSIGDDWGRANTLERLGHPYHAQKKYSEAKESFIKAQQIYIRIGNDLGRANTLRGLGDLYLSQTQYTEAEESFKQAEQIYTRIGNEQGRANALTVLGDLYCSQTGFSEAEECLVQALPIYSRIGDDWGRANTLRNLGHLHRKKRRNFGSAAFYSEARDLYDRVGGLDDNGRAFRRLEILSQAAHPRPLFSVSSLRAATGH